MKKNLHRAMALFLCLTLCLGLFPSAFAEEIEICDEEPAIREVTEADEETTQTAPEEAVEEVEAAPEPETPPEEEPTKAAEEEPETYAGMESEEYVADEQAEPVNVRFRMENGEFLACITVTDADGQVFDPIIDVESGEIQYGSYLLMPGDYVYCFHDETDVYVDLEEPFRVEEYSWQIITLDPEPVLEEYTFSFTWIDPIYANVLTEDDIPKSPYGPEEMIAELRELASTMGGGRRSDAKYLLDSKIVHQSVESAAAELKEQIMGFEETATIRLACASNTDLATWERLCIEVMRTALAHTGVSTEGDYLRYEHGGYSANGGVVYNKKTQITCCKFDYTLVQFVSAEQEAALTPVVNGILESLSLSGKNDYEKVLAIYQYLCDNVQYGGSDNLRFTAYGALVNKLAYCQGFAAAFYRLCLEADVDTRVITSSDMDHAWNIVKMGGMFYEIDATLDKGYTPSYYRYFLRGSTSWLANHTISGISVIGDQFNDSAFAAQYPLPTYDYRASITQQPADASVVIGGKVSFSMAASGADLQYRWQTMAAGESEWQTVPDAVATSLNLTPTLEDNGRQYRCEVSNLAGPVYTGAATLTVNNYTYTFALNLAENIGINFYVGGGENYEGLTISWTKKDGTAVSKAVTDGMLLENGKYFFALENMAAKEMTVPILVTITDAGGNVLKQTSCSIKSYCDKVAELEGYEKLKALCQATLDYGTFAQIYFNYRTDELANSDADASALPTVPDDYRVTQLATCTGIESASMSLTMEYKTRINIYFIPESSAYTASQYEASVTAPSGETTTAEIATSQAGILLVTIPDIVARGLSDMYTVTLTNKKDGTQTTVTAAALSYPWLVQNGEAKKANVSKALYNYYLKAAAFIQ